MILENELKKIIGSVWYLRDRFDIVTKNKRILDRTKSVEGIVRIMSKYDPRKKDFTDRLVIDNFMGSLQNFLTGYDLQSIHLSSKAMEVAFLMNIEAPTREEKSRLGGKIRSFEALRRIVIDRGLIKTPDGRKASRRVIDRRNMAVHDAILKQAIEIEQARWVERIQNRIPKNFRKILVAIVFSEYRKRLKEWKNLPDFSWYVTKKSDIVTRELLQDFFKILDQKMMQIGSFQDQSWIAKAKQFPGKIKEIRDSISGGEADFFKHCSKENLKDVKIVLDDIYENRLFT